MSVARNQEEPENQEEGKQVHGVRGQDNVWNFFHF